MPSDEEAPVSAAEVPEPEEPAAPETVAGEVVQHPAVREEQTPASALDRAAEAALSMPGMPGHDEFLTLAMTAKMLSLSGAAPKLVKGNPYVAFHVAMVGRDLGISPSAALSLIDVIDSKNGPQLSLSPELNLALLHRQGIGDVRVVVREVDRAVAVALGPGGDLDPRCVPDWPKHRDDCRCHGLRGYSEFTWEDARMADLVGEECAPGNHKTKERSRQDGSKYRSCGCNQGYKTYPKRMFGWRAIGYAISDWFPEVGVGLYSPEELGAVVDENGRAIDPASVELPDGYGSSSGRGSGSSEETPASEDDKNDLLRRVAALPEGGRTALKEAWDATRTTEGVSPLASVRALPAKQVARAKALVDSFWKRAEKGEWGDWSRPSDPGTGEAPPPTAAPSEEPPVEVVESTPEKEAAADSLQRIIESVRLLEDAEVDVALRGRFHVEPDGNANKRRLTLASLIFQEETGQDFHLHVRRAETGDETAPRVPVEAPPAAEGEAPPDPGPGPETPGEPVLAVESVDPAVAVRAAAVAEVAEMKPSAVTAALQDRDLDRSGKPEDRRARLVDALVEERRTF